jgi:hypothetical protein
MGLLKDTQCAGAISAALDPTEALVVRQAALRAIAALGDTSLADALIVAITDPDVSIRRNAAETLAKLGGTDRHIDALWPRLAPEVETDEATRQVVTRACIDLLAKRPAAQIESRLATLPGNGPDHTERLLDLLGRLLAKTQEVAPAARDRLGVIEARMAALHAEAGQVDPALERYRSAVEHLHVAESPALSRVAAAFLRLALVSRKYDASVAAALAAVNPGVSHEALWEAIATEVQALLTPETAEQALELLDAVEAHPPPGLPATQAADLRAKALQIMRPAAATSQPRAPASQPTASADG